MERSGKPYSTHRSIIAPDKLAPKLLAPLTPRQLHDSILTVHASAQGFRYLRYLQCYSMAEMDIPHRSSSTLFLISTKFIYCK